MVQMPSASERSFLQAPGRLFGGDLEPGNCFLGSRQAATFWRRRSRRASGPETTRQACHPGSPSLRKVIFPRTGHLRADVLWPDTKPVFRWHQSSSSDGSCVLPRVGISLRGRSVAAAHWSLDLKANTSQLVRVAALDAQVTSIAWHPMKKEAIYATANREWIGGGSQHHVPRGSWSPLVLCIYECTEDWKPN
ncbi:hypothetical protein WJX74_006328 [Apatococcus lobatus]|uniref:Uncharacterized protein n=1 Tax=Apatococcus lobatus TaxID=904363 RepID=A0AAW1QMY5_9CHLO